jgi:hypothetical protein
MALTDEHWDKINRLIYYRARIAGVQGDVEQLVLMFKEYWQEFSDERGLDATIAALEHDELLEQRAATASKLAELDAAIAALDPEEEPK